MHVITENDIDALYTKAVLYTSRKGTHVGNTTELSPVSFVREDNTNIDIISVRDISLSYVIGELLWYFSQRNDLEFISKFSNYWKLITDDNTTCNSAYGHIVFKRDYDQLEQVVEILKNDRNSRRAIINFNIPNKYREYTKDEICTIALQFLVRRDKLDCHVYMRSCDLYTGFPYDYIFFSCLQHMIAKRLNVGVGSYHHTCTSLHFYDKNVDDMERIATYNLTKNRERYTFNLEQFLLNHVLLYIFARDLKADRKDMHEILVNLCKNLKILEVKDE